MDEIINQLSNKFLRSLSSNLSKTAKQSPAIYSDPSLQIVLHLITCTRTLCDMFEMNTNSDSKNNTNGNISMQIFQPVINGILALLGKLLMDSFTFEPKISEIKIYSEAYDLIGKHILTLFPEMATKKHKTTGKMLIHHAVFKAKPSIAEVTVNQILRVSPICASSADSAGALPIHWATRNPDVGIEVVHSLIKAYPQSPMAKDIKGYLPLHWAVNQDQPNLELIRTLLKQYPNSANERTSSGDLALHYCVCRMRPSIPIIKALIDINPDAIKTPCHVEGYLPLHRFLHRPLVDLEVLTLLLNYYPEAVTTMSYRNQSPLHIALDNQIPDAVAINMLLENEYAEGVCKLQDADGYLPLHLILDSSTPNYELARKILSINPKAASHASRDHMLPLHVLVGSNNNPDVMFVKQLVYAFPDALVQSVKDIIPAVNGLAMADQDSWSGEWVETAWTPSSRAKDRGLKSLGILFDEMLLEMQSNPVSFAMKASQHNINKPPLLEKGGNSPSTPIINQSLKNTFPLSTATTTNTTQVSTINNVETSNDKTMSSLSNKAAYKPNIISHREIPPHILKARLKVQSANGSRDSSPTIERDVSPSAITAGNNNTTKQQQQQFEAQTYPSVTPGALLMNPTGEIPAHILKARKQVQSASISRDPSPSNIQQQQQGRGPPTGPIPTNLLQAANRHLIRLDSSGSQCVSQQQETAPMSPGDIIRNLSAKSRPPHAVSLQQQPRGEDRRPYSPYNNANTTRAIRGGNNAWEQQSEDMQKVNSTNVITNYSNDLNKPEKRAISAKQSRLLQAQQQYIKRIGKFTGGSSASVVPYNSVNNNNEGNNNNPNDDEQLLLDTSIPNDNFRIRRSSGGGGLVHSFNSNTGGGNNVDDMV